MIRLMAMAMPTLWFKDTQLFRNILTETNIMFEQVLDVILNHRLNRPINLPSASMCPSIAFLRSFLVELGANPSSKSRA
jgi:hypothetical protein